MVFVAEGLTAALQQPLVEAGLTQHLLVPLAVHQELKDVGDGKLEVQSVLKRENWRLNVNLFLSLLSLESDLSPRVGSRSRRREAGPTWPKRPRGG